uniref:AlgX/AlgJ SGNH hydrolase-like domain-containing protein n=1 Tax=Fundidesulfovibrio putealis TaxID=270496 RepID=A0A7C4EJP9_9BACT
MAVLTSAVFIAAVCIPTAAKLLGINPDVPLQEALADRMPKKFEHMGHVETAAKELRRGWLDQRFGLRRVLVRWQRLLDIKALDSSTPWDPVLVSDGDWLFLAQENQGINVIMDWRATRPFTREELAFWVGVYVQRRDWLAAQNIPYLLVVAPNKSTIYPERVSHRFGRSGLPSRLDQLLEALAVAGVDVVDLRRSQMEAKATGRKAYYRSDSHWSPLGAYFGYAEVILRLKDRFPQLSPAPLSDFSFSEAPGLPGGLAGMIALGGMYPENALIMTPLTPRTAKVVEGEPAQINHFQPLAVYTNDKPDLPRAVIVRDSFSHEMMPFLAEHFSRLVCLWPYPTNTVSVRSLMPEQIAAEKPDIVIEEFVERYFIHIPPANLLKAQAPQ